MIELPTIVLDPNWFDAWTNGNWFKAVFDPLTWRLTRSGAILLIGVPFAIGLWTQSESIVMRAVLLTLFMGLLLGGAPAGATIVGYVLVIGATILAYRSISGVGKGI